MNGKLPGSVYIVCTIKGIDDMKFMFEICTYNLHFQNNKEQVQKFCAHKNYLYVVVRLSIENVSFSIFHPKYTRAPELFCRPKEKHEFCDI